MPDDSSPAVLDPATRDDWYVVSHASEIQPGVVERTRLLGRDLLVTRAADGTLKAECFDPDGAPVPVERIAERYGFIWVSLGAPRDEILRIPEFAEGGRRLIWRGRIGVAASGQRVIENFFDLSHFSFVHTGTLGGLDAAEVPRYEVEYREEGKELWAVGCSFFQPKASASAAGGASVRYDYRVPSPFICVLYKDSLVRPGMKDLIGLFIQPCEEERCVVHSFALVFDDHRSDTDILHFYHEIFMQDRMILIQQRPLRIPVHPQRERHVVSDASAVAFRRWIARRGFRFGVDDAAA